ncbi:hypothetical protein N7G274_001157 [Stereocaulon virgatum]|uniref:Dihydrofolate reductase n=1 Tax=Stereocaulon virgatum TaxID=373712 RepID=A0ABR4AUJ4_9LECA
MGRKTWDSLPANVRPLKGRINVIVSHTPQALQLPEKEAGQEPVIAASSIEEGLRKLQDTYPPSPLAAAAAGAMSQGSISTSLDVPFEPSQFQSQRQRQRAPPAPAQRAQAPQDTLGRVFVIGGAEIYKSALEMECCGRILWTRVAGEWECDVFFPRGVLPVGGGGSGGGGGRWVVRSMGELERWVGEEGVGGLRREGDVEFEVRMVEREMG